jgi:hypothetical protein
MLMWRGLVNMYNTASATSSDVSPAPVVTPLATAALSVTCQRSFSTTPGATAPIRTPAPISCRRRVLGANWLGTVLVSLGRDGAVLVDGNGALHGRTAAVTALNPVGAGDAFLAGYLAADANGSRPADRLASALRWGATAVQHQGTLLSRVDDRISVHVTAADPDVVLSEPATP